MIEICCWGNTVKTKSPIILDNFNKTRRERNSLIIE